MKTSTNARTILQQHKLFSQALEALFPIITDAARGDLAARHKLGVLARLLTMGDQIIDALPVDPRNRLGLYSQLAALQDALEIYDFLSRNYPGAGQPQPGGR
jgi:hypothetical protein